MAATLYSVRNRLNAFIDSHGDKTVENVEDELKELIQFAISETWDEAQREIDNM